MLDVRTAQTDLENAIRDTILYAMGRRIAQVATVADLRLVPTQGETTTALHNDHLITVATPATAYRWSQESVAADNGTTVIKPDDVIGGTGRWKSWTSSLRFSPVVGGVAYYLHELTTGPLQRVIILDKSMTEEEINALVFAQVPAVVIEATDDDPEDATQETGHRWLTDYHFTISVIAQNLRDRREAAQGPGVTADIDPGANSIDGFIKALISGTGLHAVIDGIRNVQIGRGHNWLSEYGQRRVIRSRVFTFQVTEENPNAPGDYGAEEEVVYQPQLTDLGQLPVQTGVCDTPPPPPPPPYFDPDNFCISGITVPTGVGFTKPVAAGQAILDGAAVVYAGELHTFGSQADTYRDLLPNGTLVFVEVTAQGEAPPLTPTAMRIGVTRTNGSGVVDDRYIVATKFDYGPEIHHSLL